MPEVAVVAVVVATPTQKLAAHEPSVRWLLPSLVGLGLALAVKGIPTG